MSALEIQPVITVTAVKQTASSDCCAAKLRPGAPPDGYECTACGQPCQRVLSEPEEVTFRG